MSKRKFFFSFLVLVASFGLLLGGSAVEAQTVSPHFSFSPAATTIETGETLAVAVEINTGGKSISSADAVVAFDSSLLEVTSVEEGRFFPTTTSDTSVLGEVKIYGVAIAMPPKPVPERWPRLILRPKRQAQPGLLLVAKAVQRPIPISTKGK